MPAANFVAGSAILKLYWIVNGQLCMNVLGCVKPGGLVISQTTADALGTSIKSAFTTNLASLFATTSSLQRVGIRDYSSPNMPEFRDTLTPVAGVDTTPALPGQTASVVTLRTVQSGKRGRGRVYLTGWSELANETQGQQSSATNTAGINFVEAIDNALEAVTMDLAVLGRPSLAVRVERITTETDGTEIVDTISRQQARAGQVLPVTIVEVRSGVWESQRRRVNGRGGGLAALLSQASRTL